MTPNLVVFDLDFTLWDAGGLWCDCTTPPYHFNPQGKLVDQGNRHIRLYDDAIPILEKLSSLSIPIALASRTDQPSWANQLTKLLGIDPFVQFREIYPGSKITHLRNLSRESGVSLENIMFFDDEYRNIVDAQKIGVHALLVTSGINASIFTQETGIAL
jgi:magnesium-dependent phosphatase 1